MSIAVMYILTISLLKIFALLVLKTILSRIPDQIGDRSRFLQTIKSVAQLTTYLLHCIIMLGI